MKLAKLLTTSCSMLIAVFSLSCANKPEVSSNSKPDTTNAILIEGKVSSIGHGSGSGADGKMHESHTIDIISNGKDYSCNFPVENSRSVLGEDVPNMEALRAKNLTGKY